MAGKKSNINEPTFEQALNELEEIVRLMEEGSLDLDGALAKFEKGIALSRVCAKKLEQAEKKIDMLLCSENGEITLKPANISEDRNE
ncbi:MAG: exodeoxyribonuclease VII small subunit [Eubacteriales bacterium]